MSKREEMGKNARECGSRVFIENVHTATSTIIYTPLRKNKAGMQECFMIRVPDVVFPWCI